MKLGSMVAVLLIAGLFSGCSAQLTAVPISEKARLEMGGTEGIPYYVPRPYLLVTRDLEITDEALGEAGIAADLLSRPASASATRAGNGGTSSVAAGSRPAVTRAEDDDADAGAIQVRPAYRFRIVYLPDLSRQYALKQRGGAFSNVTIKYELQNGWLFTGTEISVDNQVPAAIEATTSGVANILGASIEQVFASLFPIPTPDYGVSGVAEGGAIDAGPRIWLFEISDGPQGTLRINTERPFFEWPKETARSSRPTRRPVEPAGSRDPDAGDLSPPARPGQTGQPPSPAPAPGDRPPASSPENAQPPVKPGPTAPETAPTPGQVPPAPAP